MKTAVRTYQHESTLQGERIGMSIDESALAHIMSVLTDLYSDPEMAVVREYATNAYDSHVEAGVNRPIEVTLPTTLSPYLKIRDYGLGMDIEDIRNTYSRYGTSTKRDTNDLVGTLGLGCKSALTYTNQFTLTAVKDGVCTQVSISRDEDGAGSMTIVAEYETDNPSGVEISVPVKSHNAFTGKAQYLFQFWAEGTVLVNGEEPKRVSGIELADDILIVDKDTLEYSVVVMGNVPYPVTAYSSHNYRYVAFVPIGAVQFTPSREALQMTPATKAVIEEIDQRIVDGKQGAIERLINAAGSRNEALLLSLKFGRLFSYKGTLNYGTEEIPSGLEAVDGEKFVTVNRFRRRYHKSQETGIKALPISVVTKAVFLTGYTNTSFSSTARQKLDQWWMRVGNGTECEQFVLVNTLPCSEWIDPSRVFDWETVKAEKIARATERQDGRPSGSYEALVDGTHMHIQAEDIDLSEPLLYHVGTGYGYQAMRNVRAAMPTATIVELSTNRVAKFLRNFPHAVSVDEAAEKLGQAWADSLRDVEIIWLKLRQDASDYLERLDRDRIEDPALRVAIRIASKDRTALKQAYDKYGVELREVAGYFNPLERYPLLESVLDNFRYHSHTDGKLDKVLDHLYMYINAVYATEREAVAS